MMELTAAQLHALAEEYLEVEPLGAVEQEHIEMLPETFAGEEYGRRDVEWVVQWYFRRYLGGYPDKERRETEDRFRDNDFSAVLETLATVADSRDDTAENLRQLCELSGVDVPVASAFLQFTHPDRYVALDSRLWEILGECDELEGPYPAEPTVETYCRFDDACQRLTARFEVDPWTLYRGLWRLWQERHGER